MDSPTSGATSNHSSVPGDFTNSVAINLVRLSWNYANQGVHIPKLPQKENGLPIQFPFMARISTPGTWNQKITLNKDALRRGFVSASRFREKLRCNLAMETTIDVDISSIRNVEMTASPSAGWMALKLEMLFYETGGLMDLLAFMNAAYDSASGAGFLEVEILRNGKKVARKQLPLERCLRNVDVPNSKSGHPWEFTCHLPLQDLTEGDQNREFSGLKYFFLRTDRIEQAEVKHLGCFFCRKQYGTIAKLMSHLKYEHELSVLLEKHPLHKSSGKWAMITVLAPPESQDKTQIFDKDTASDAFDSRQSTDNDSRRHGMEDRSTDRREQNGHRYNLPSPGESSSKSSAVKHKSATMQHFTPIAPKPSEGESNGVSVSQTKNDPAKKSELQKPLNNTSPTLALRDQRPSHTPQNGNTRDKVPYPTLLSKNSSVTSATRMVERNGYARTSTIPLPLKQNGDGGVLPPSNNLNNRAEAPVIEISSDSGESIAVQILDKTQTAKVVANIFEEYGLESRRKGSLSARKSRTPSSSRSKPSAQESNKVSKKPSFCTEVEPLPPVKKRKRAVPTALPGVTFYRNTSKRALQEGEILSDSDSEVDNAYTKMRHRQHIDKIQGATEAEKAFMKLFDSHFQDEQHSGDKFVGEGLIRFAMAEQATFRCADMYQLFCTQAAVLKMENIVSDAQIFKCIDTIRGLKDNGNDDERWKDLEPPLFSRNATKPAPKPWQQTCLCGEVVEASYDTICCDNIECVRGIFHLKCVGLEKAPKEWNCSECTRLDKGVA